MKLPKTNVVLYRIEIIHDGVTLYLKDTRKMIFTDEPGYFWSRENLADKYLEDVKIHFPNATISTIMRDEYETIESSYVKQNIKVCSDKQVELTTHTPRVYHKKDDDVVIDEVVTEDIDPMILFKELCPKCLTCIHECKQSHIATIVRCAEYQKIA